MQTKSNEDAHNEHHYIPKFLLNEWHSGEKNKLSQIRWIRGELKEKRYKGKSVAKERHLYSMNKYSEKPNTEIEPKFITKYVDDPASIAHKNILKSEKLKVSQDDKHAWTRFLVSLVYRGPGAIDFLREQGINALSSQFPENADDNTEMSAELKELWTLYKNRDKSLLDFATYYLPDLIQDSEYNKLFFESKWKIRRLPNGTEPLLIGDRPLTLFGPQTKLDLVYLPLAPNVAFFTSRCEHLWSQINSLPDKIFIRKMNRAMVEQASIYVWGKDFSHKKLIEMRLKTTPAGLGLGIGDRTEK